MIQLWFTIENKRNPIIPDHSNLTLLYEHLILAYVWVLMYTYRIRRFHRKLESLTTLGINLDILKTRTELNFSSLYGEVGTNVTTFSISFNLYLIEYSYHHIPIKV